MHSDASALDLILTADPGLLAVVRLSLIVSLSALAISALIGIPFGAFVTLLAGFGRAAAEVGAIIIVGGNIDGYTRTMTTAIALETSKGDLPLAMGLGVVLIAIVIAVNALAWLVRRVGERIAG